MSLIDSVLDGLTIEKIDKNTSLLKELNEEMWNGHTFIHKEQLSAIIEDPADNEIVIEDDRIYLQYIHHAEVEAAQGVQRLVGVPAPEISIPERPTSGQFLPTDQQWQAIENVFKHRFSVIRGLPGTGKSTLVYLLLNLIDQHPYFENNWQKYELACPTGKAARRLTETTGRDAQTIHRALGYYPGSGFMHNINNPHWADVMVIDEASMIDIRLASALVNAIGPKTRLVLIGDGQQLPPVGAGKFFEEMAQHPNIPSTHLTDIFRQAGKSLIVQNAHRIINGKEPYLSAEAAGSGTNEDFVFIDKPSSQIPRFVSHLVSEELPNRYPNLSPLHDTMVIAPMRPTVAGLNNLNAELRKSLNPTGAPIGIKEFHEGDRILCTANRYNIDIMNGEMGTIDEVDHANQRITLNMGYRQTVIPFEELSNFTDGFAISIHKSQGSQAPVVIVVLDKYHKRMLNRELINTAITRAQIMCIVVSQQGTIQEAVMKSAPARRSSLSWRITQGNNHVNVSSTTT